MKVLYTVVVSVVLLLVFIKNIDDKEDVAIEGKRSIKVEQPIYIEEQPEKIEPQTQNTVLKVDAGDDEVLVLGKKITLEAKISEEVEIASYQWREGEKVLSDKESFSTLLSLGVHSIILTITDNQGRKAEDEVLISVGKYYMIKEISHENNSTEYNSYNSEGNITKESIDDGNDETIDRVYITNYDDAGRVIYRGSDYGGDGELDSEFHYTYGDNGNLIEYRYSYREEDTETYQYTYNEKNQKIGSVLQKDGIETEIETFLYDDAGNNVKVLIDSDGDEIIDGEKFYSYNSNSKVTEEVEKDMEGNITSKTVMRYHENGKYSFYSADWDGDGTPNMIFELNENEDAIHSQYEVQEDGTYKYDQTRSYTDSGKVKEINGSWVFGEKESAIYTYDNNEDKILYVKKYDEEGKDLGKEYYHYDEHGNLIEIVNEDGEILSSWEYEFIIGER